MQGLRCSRRVKFGDLEDLAVNVQCLRPALVTQKFDSTLLRGMDSAVPDIELEYIKHWGYWSIQEPF
jgi:hypothetical protein